MNYNFSKGKMKFQCSIVVFFLTFILFISGFGNVSLFTPAFAACTLPANVGGGGTDNDCDGISNTWEANTTAFPGANPNVKDVYLDLDYMTGHLPDSLTVLTPIINKFHDQGRELRIMDIDAITHQDTLNIWSDFDTIRDTGCGGGGGCLGSGLSQTIQDMRKNVFHYGLFIHFYEDPATPGSDASFSGKSRDSRSFVVSMGSFAQSGGHGVGSTEEQKGTLMHELGHNLGLRHGGSDDVNCKPNYLSVMSYSFQMPIFVGLRPADYSQSDLPDLNELHLNEVAGIPASTPPFLKTVYSTPPPGPLVVRQTGQAFNWNWDGDYSDTDVKVNINKLGISDCNSTTNSTLTGWNDWINLQYWGAGIGQPGNETAGINESSTINDVSTLEGAFGLNEASAITDPQQGDNQSVAELSIQDVIKSRYSLLNGTQDYIQNLNNSFFVNNTSKALVLDILNKQVKPFLGGDNQSTTLNQTASKVVISDNPTSTGTDDPPDPLTDAIDGLMELRTYFDGYVGGDEANDVVTDPSISSPIIDIIDNYIAALRNQIAVP